MASAWWSDYWIYHEPGKQTIYVSDGKWFQSRSTSSIVSELEEAIRDDAVFYKQFGLDESWSGMSQRIGFAFVDLGAGALAAAGGVALAVVPEPTLITKAGAGLAFAAAGNQFVAGGTALLGRESRVDLIHSALDSYYESPNQIHVKLVSSCKSLIQSHYSNVPSIERITIPLPPLDVQKRYADVLDNFEMICNDLTSGLPAEIEARKKQYEYYRDKLLTFKEKTS